LLIPISLALAAAGEPKQVITHTLLQNVFHVQADILRDPRLDVPICVPYALVTHEDAACDASKIHGSQPVNNQFLADRP
jgi:iron complex transport system ATP-binding protein